MRDNRPPFLAEVDGPVGSAYLDGHLAGMYGSDRIGHTSQDAVYSLEAISGGNDVHSALRTAPMSRIAKKMSANNVSMARAGTVSNSSVSYNASQLR